MECFRRVFKKWGRNRSLGGCLVATVLACSCAASNPSPPDAGNTPDAGSAPQDLAELLGPIRTARGVPALGAAVVKSGRLEALGAVGVRKLGNATPVTHQDLWHLGSNTKAMTSTVAALLVDDGKLMWTSTVGASFPELGASLSTGYAGVTLEQLLSHRGGLPANPQSDIWAAMWQRNAENPSVVRTWAVEEMLKRVPGTVGAFVYSNAGYMTAGRIIEKAAPGEWEALVRQRLFQPLGMTSCDFGVPGTIGAVNQPWGHQANGSTLTPIQGDNPLSLGPAGTAYCTLEDWAKFAAMHLKGARGEPAMVSAAGFTKLHTPAAGGDYALGWVVTSGSRKQLWHNGSNTLWYAEVWLIPSRDVAILVTTNCATTRCQQAVADSVFQLRESWAP